VLATATCGVLRMKCNSWMKIKSWIYIAVFYKETGKNIASKGIHFFKSYSFSELDNEYIGINNVLVIVYIAHNIKLEYQEVTDPYTKEKYFEYAHDGKLMGRLLIPSNPENQ
jgi:hypothetical protein